MKPNRILSIAAGFALACCGSVFGAVIGELGVLDSSANGGINPATGNPWQAGDAYRLIFVTSTRTTGSSTDADGDGKVRVVLTGDPSDFLRAQTAP